MSTATIDAPSEVIEIPEWITSDTLYEIIDGEYVEKEPMGAAAEFIANTLVGIINDFSKSDKGRAFNEILISLPGASNKLRPDAFYVPYEKWPKGKIPPLNGAWEVLPDACFEIISPSDEFEDIMAKKDEYFQFGVRQVWIVSPATKFLQIYTSPAESRGYHVPAVVDCSSLIPGFQLNLAEVL